MKNLMLFVLEDLRQDRTAVERNLDLQIENSLELGWRREDLLILTNFPFVRGGVSAVEVHPPRRPATSRATSFYKTWCILSVLETLAPGETVWYHDVDVYQLEPFGEPPSRRTMAFCLYTTRERLLVQGGSMFFGAAARPIFDAVMDQLTNHRVRKDEYALTSLVARSEFLDCFEVLDYSWNLGDTDFAVRYQLARKPIKAVHFHLDRADHAAKFLHGRNSLGVHPLPGRFVELLHRHGLWTAPQTGAARPRTGLRAIFERLRGRRRSG
jgi:hypothetical protein